MAIERELVLVVVFGGQYNQLIARRVREHNVYCEIIPYTTSVEDIKKKNPKAIIFTGGPNSVYGEGTPRVEKEIFELGVPVLGICYGHQLTAYTLGGKVESPDIREYGKTEVKIDNNSPLFDGIKRSEEHTSELQSRQYLVCRLLLEKKKLKPSPAQAAEVIL